jgi:predicted Zn-dependent protease with MMP-like domain
MRFVPDNGRVLVMTREEFEELVAEALDRIPPELTRLMDNVAVFVEDEPPADDPELLGLYEGTPLTERGEWYAGVLPDRITIYRGPTLRMCATREDVVAETEITVVHEIAHHFGIDDARLHALGYGGARTADRPGRAVSAGDTACPLAGSGSWGRRPRSVHRRWPRAPVVRTRP